MEALQLPAQLCSCPRRAGFSLIAPELSQSLAGLTQRRRIVDKGRKCRLERSKQRSRLLQKLCKDIICRVPSKC